MWCKYETGYAGICGRFVKDGERCEKHLGLKSKPKIEKIQRFRGDSVWQKEEGRFVSK